MDRRQVLSLKSGRSGEVLKDEDAVLMYPVGCANRGRRVKWSERGRFGEWSRAVGSRGRGTDLTNGRVKLLHLDAIGRRSWRLWGELRNAGFVVGIWTENVARSGANSLRSKLSSQSPAMAHVGGSPEVTPSATTTPFRSSYSAIPS
jgi:hypothetical protein